MRRPLAILAQQVRIDMRLVVRAAEAFARDWHCKALEETYDTANGVIAAVRELRLSRRRLARAKRTGGGHA